MITIMVMINVDDHHHDHEFHLMMIISYMEKRFDHLHDHRFHDHYDDYDSVDHEDVFRRAV